MASEYRLTRRVNFYETDAAGIVHFSTYFRYMEEAEHALWRSAGLDIHAAAVDVGFPRVAASFEYNRPLRPGDEFDVLMRVSAMTRKTIQYTCLIMQGDVKIATGTQTIVCVRFRMNEPMTAIEIPAHIAERFQVAPALAT